MNIASVVKGRYLNIFASQEQNTDRRLYIQIKERLRLYNEYKLSILMFFKSNGPRMVIKYFGDILRTSYFCMVHSPHVGAYTNSMLVLND